HHGRARQSDRHPRGEPADRRQRGGDPGADRAVLGAAGVVHDADPHPGAAAGSGLRVPGRVKAAVLAGAALFLAALPALGFAAFYESLLYLVFFWVALATSWAILSGFSGYFSF